MYNQFHYFLTDLREIWYQRYEQNAVQQSRILWKSASRQAMLLLWASMELHLRVNRETKWHFESKERLGTVRVVRHATQRTTPSASTHNAVNDHCSTPSPNLLWAPRKRTPTLITKSTRLLRSYDAQYWRQDRAHGGVGVWDSERVRCS